MEDNKYNSNQTIDLSSGFKKQPVYSNDLGFSYNSNHSNNFQGSVLTKLVIKLSGGKIKTANQAQLVLLGVMIMAIVVTLVMIFRGGNENSSVDNKKTKNQMEQILKRQPSLPI